MPKLNISQTNLQAMHQQLKAVYDSEATEEASFEPVMKEISAGRTEVLQRINIAKGLIGGYFKTIDLNSGGKKSDKNNKDVEQGEKAGDKGKGSGTKGSGA